MAIVTCQAGLRVFTRGEPFTTGHAARRQPCQRNVRAIGARRSVVRCASAQADHGQQDGAKQREKMARTVAHRLVAVGQVRCDVSQLLVGLIVHLRLHGWVDPFAVAVIDHRAEQVGFRLAADAWNAKVRVRVVVARAAMTAETGRDRALAFGRIAMQWSAVGDSLRHPCLAAQKGEQ